MYAQNKTFNLKKSRWLILLFLLLNSSLLLADGAIILIGDSIPENRPSGTFIGTLQLDSSSVGISFTFQSRVDEAAFFISGDSLFSSTSFNYEADTVFHLAMYAWLGNLVLAENSVAVRIKDLHGKFDRNGIADEEVAAIFPQVAAGDYLFLEPNVGTDNLFYGGGITRISYPAKIWIRADEYDVILINLDSLAGNSPEERIIISNLEGQVKARKVLLEGGKFWRLSGQWSEQQGIGHKSFRGCDSDSSSVNFGYSSGKYGWWISNSYTSDEVGLQVYGTATGFEIDHIEICDGGFAGLMIKSEDGTEDMEDVSLHHLYIHDVGGEGMYLGSTNPDPQHQFNRLTVEYCALLRTGAEALQAGQLGPGCVISNNVLWGGMDWMAPFALHQDHGMQIATRNGGTLVENNIILGSGNGFLNIRMNPHPEQSPNDDSLIFRNNLGWQCRGPLAAFMGEETNFVTPVLWKENYFGDFRYDYDRVYLNRPLSNHLIRVASFGIDVAFQDNLQDDKVRRLFDRWGATGNLINLGNHQVDLPKPEFRGMPIDNFLDWKFYTDTVGNAIDFPEKNTRKGEIATFQPGEVVGLPVDGTTRYYRCLQPVIGQQPGRLGDEFWELMIWEHNGDSSYIPPDDVRCTPESFYYQRGMGVENTPPKTQSILLHEEAAEEVKVLEISPNPSTGRIKISPPGYQEGLLTVYSSTGQHISESFLKVGQTELDLSAQAPGVYLITLLQNNQQYSGRVLIR